MSHTVQPHNVTPSPAVRPGHRLAPAAIGRSTDTPQIVLLQCPDYCTEDHVAAGQVAVEDIVHSSETAHVGVESFLTGRLALELYATVTARPASHDPRLRQAHIVLDDGSDDAHLTADMAEETAADLERLAAKLREAARTARLHNQHAAEVA